MQRICLTMKFDLWIGSRELNFSSEALKKWSLNSTLTLDLQSWFKVTETIQLGAFYELESNWVNRGVKLQTQIFIHVFFVVFFLHFDLWSRKLVQSRCTPSIYGHFSNEDWVWLSHKEKEIHAPTKRNHCKL